MHEPKMITAQDEEGFILHGCQLLKEIITAAIEKHGKAIIGLSGGETPKKIYEAFGKAKDIDWSKVWIFLVDDRYIRRDDPRSNQFLLRSTLLKNAPIPESQIVFPDTSLPYEECITLFDQHLTALFQKSSPDLVTLGLGEDGHIASLFPPLKERAEDRGQRAIGTTTDRFAICERISVTLPVLTSARSALFLIKGGAKKRVWDEMMASTEGEARWPAKAVLENMETTLLFGL